MPGSNANAELLTILLDAGKINETQYRAILDEAVSTGKTAEELVLEKKLVDDDFMARAKGTLLGLPYLDLVGKEVPAAILNIIPRDVAENAKAIAFDRDADSVSIGMINPRDTVGMQSLDFLAQISGFRPKYYVISKASFDEMFKKYGSIGGDVAAALVAAKEKFVPDKAVAAERFQNIEEIIKGAPVTRIVSVVLRHAVEGGASDIHIEPYGEETRIRYRIDGVLHTTLTLPKYIHTSLVARVKVLSNMKLDETRVPQDGRITEIVNGHVIDFRVSTMPLADSEKVVMRILDTTKGVPTLESLGFRPEFIAMIRLEVRKPHGIFLITGPTGSGKSTTLFTALNMRNEEAVNIATLEDPIEYYIKGVNQSQVRPEVGYNFASALRALLRQDPNIIMVGEIRDGETGELAIHAALTGHLILSTLHTNDAIGAVPRLMDMHVEPFLLSATINMVIAQRLARKNCERCKAQITLPDEVETAIRKELDAIPKKYMKHLDLKGEHLPMFKGRGCVRCNNSGYIGRVAVSEIIVFDSKLRDLIIKGFPIAEVREVLRQQEVLTIREDGLLKALEGSTTIEEVMRITDIT